MHKIMNVKVLDDYHLEVLFENGKNFRFDVKPYLYGEVFEPLKNKELFNQVSVDDELGTIVWPTGADFCPDSLYFKLSDELNKQPLNKDPSKSLLAEDVFK